MGARGHCWYQSSSSSWSSVEGRKSTLGRFIRRHNCRLKKDIQLESCELSFNWGKMRTAAREAASQVALLQGGSGEKSIYKVLVTGEFNATKQSFYKSFFVSHDDLVSP